MSQRITDILVAVDVERMLSSLSKVKDRYNLIDQQCIHMMTYDGVVISDQGGSELNIAAGIGDVIRWREVTLSADANYSIVLCYFSPSADLSKYLTPAQLIPGFKYIPFLKSIDPLQVIPGPRVQNHYWECSVIDRPESEAIKLQYTFDFTVYDNTMKPVGYGKWDPFITITAY
ncbi:hypothetical protein EAE91_19845 [Photorhabdus noenieputensis]|uniref:AidA/PixA family protein n=1 Tax=Photorhabdus noenieputensis TaxID=1208607 RepID=UPI001BD47AA9|nr:AidA/PixA family protein [Photorhabdus noenieputensis]MBS9439312.1 hypothetical protein [Photorhabdus noenieputensis]MCK3671499.1 inclusion body family protein [Photorhabdus noenieputensis]